MKYIIFLLFIFGCTTLESPKTKDGVDLCRDFCGGSGQEHSDVLYMGAGTCLCTNVEGIKNSWHLCRAWNPHSKERCAERESQQLKRYEINSIKQRKQR